MTDRTRTAFVDTRPRPPEREGFHVHPTAPLPRLDSRHPSIHPSGAGREPHRLPSWIVLPLGLALCGGWAAAIWMSTHLEPDSTLHSVALFVHLAAMVAGFGAVLVVDWLGLLWSVGRRTFAEVTRTADAVHTLIWLSLAGLTFSGMLLNPDPSSTLTRIKLALVLVAGLNGLHAHLLQGRMIALGDRPPPPPLLVLAGATASVSQACWWTAMFIGFLNHQS